jgi:hypothetical protein
MLGFQKAKLMSKNKPMTNHTSDFGFQFFDRSDSGLTKSNSAQLILNSNQMYNIFTKVVVIKVVKL